MAKSNLVGKRFQIVLTLGALPNGHPSFEVAATEIDSGTLKNIDAHAAMGMVHRAMGIYIQSIQPQPEPQSQIVLPTGPMSNIRGN